MRLVTNELKNSFKGKILKEIDFLETESESKYKTVIYNLKMTGEKDSLYRILVHINLESEVYFCEIDFEDLIIYEFFSSKIDEIVTLSLSFLEKYIYMRKIHDNTLNNLNIPEEDILLLSDQATQFRVEEMFSNVLDGEEEIPYFGDDEDY